MKSAKLQKSSSQKLVSAISKIVLGWREYVDLPQLKIPDIKAKIDTGARTSSLHAEGLRRELINNKEWIVFFVTVEKDGKIKRVNCKAPLLMTKKIKSSTGHAEVRPVILTQIKMGDQVFETPITLTDRSEMGFKMLIGRKTLKSKFIVDCAKSFQLKKLETKE